MDLNFEALIGIIFESCFAEVAFRDESGRLDPAVVSKHVLMQFPAG